MKRFFLFIGAVIVGLAVGGLLVLHHVVRKAVTSPPVSDRPAPTSKKAPPMDTWQAGLKPDTRTDYTTDQAATKRLMKKLQREETRQRPQEERN